MQKLTILCVGKLKERHWKEAQEEYLRRISPYAKVDLIEVAAEATSSTVTPEKASSTEGSRLASRLDKLTGTMVALDEKGTRCTSEKFAELLDDMTDGGRPVVFVIGGTEGLYPDVVDHADRVVSLSTMTFTHEMARVFLLEQLYRAEMILRGKEYHR